MPVTRTHNLAGKAGRLDEKCKTVLKLAAHLVRDRIQELAPLDQGHLTRGIKVGEPKRDGVRMTVSIFSEMAYWRYLELAQYLPKTPGPKSVAKGAQIPFIMPAFLGKKAAAIHIIEEGMRRALRELAISGAK